MTSRPAKETLVSKLGFKSSSSNSKAEAELDKVRKENAHLKRKVDELAKRHAKPPESDKSKLLERILSLETMRERNNQQLKVKEQELESLRQQLSAQGGEVVALLQAQLENRRKDIEHKDELFRNLSQETENLRNKLATVSARCQSLEMQAANGQAPSGDLAMVQDQLRDALEKNQQWLVYDQQREAYVQSVLARLHDLEGQLSQAKQQQQQSKPETCSDAGEEKEKEAQLKNHYDQLMLEKLKHQAARAEEELCMQKEQNLKTLNELQCQTRQVDLLREEVVALQRRYEHKCDELESFLWKHNEKDKELQEATLQLQAERISNRRTVSEESRVHSERADRMRAELEDERKRAADLLLQVNMLQKSLLNQNEDQRRIAALEQQIQLTAKDSENEKIDRQSMQQQLHKVLKELRKARDQIAKLESAKPLNTRFSEPSSYNKLEFERLTIDEPACPTSPSNILDESFLECPNCRASYPTSRHRELLMHIDYCLA